MAITPIVTEADYDRALKRIERFMEVELDAKTGAEFDALVTLVHAYEEKHYPIDPPDPVDAIKFRMEQMGMRPVDLAPTLGGRNRVSEILNRRRKLSLNQIRALHRDLKMPFESLLKEV